MKSNIYTRITAVPMGHETFIWSINVEDMLFFLVQELVFYFKASYIFSSSKLVLRYGL